ncbi:hypothetical protein [Neptuniibacter halophilus]|uniref:hypothetical protein n=1 Tax=Neptuniibacter halophilus TaxID=651666 RepID=UPI002573BB4A|nr:hypothetical protein [Neptuniibacter halophilus]
MKANTVATATLIVSLLLIQGCSAVVVAGAGAAAGYLAHENGYRVQTPVKKSGE